MSNKPLTKRQIAVLSIMAGKAYKRIQSQGCPLPSLTDWRHDEVWAATGITESLTKATQEHYVPIYNRLASYLGCAPVKDRTWSEMDKAIHLLDDAMQRYEITPDYLAEIVRDQLHLPCTGRDVYQALRNWAAVEHVRQLMYTVINRGRSEARKLAAATPCRPAGWLIMSGLYVLFPLLGRISPPSGDSAVIYGCQIRRCSHE